MVVDVGVKKGHMREVGVVSTVDMVMRGVLYPPSI